MNAFTTKTLLGVVGAALGLSCTSPTLTADTISTRSIVSSDSPSSNPCASSAESTNGDSATGSSEGESSSPRPGGLGLAADTLALATGSLLPGQPTKQDRFGVLEIYPTVSEGREWYLPATTDQFDWTWYPECNDITQVSTGVFHTRGCNGEIRLNIRSPEGAAWWHNVEMTAYFRETATESAALTPHWELFARGERHNDEPMKEGDINGGDRAPLGTPTWPGYPYPAGSVIAGCLGSAYHGNVYPDGRVHFEKELSHIEGYSNTRRAESYVNGFQNPKNRWFGYKFVVYNRKAGGVHMELWLDARADGNWDLVGETNDTGGWTARDTYMNGCAKAPYKYETDQIIAWAGPWVTFRADALATDFKWFSVREIQPAG